MIASRPIGPLKTAPWTSAPSAFAEPTAEATSGTRTPKRSNPNGYGTGVLNPKTDMLPTGVSTNWDMVLLGVGVTVKTPCLVFVPPNVAIKLVTKPSKSWGITKTCVVPNWAPPAPPAVLVAGAPWANVLKYRDSLANPIVRS